MEHDSLGGDQFCSDFKEAGEQLVGLYLGRAFGAEGTASAKALRQDGDWLVPRNSEEAGVATGSVSKRGWSSDPQGAWILSRARQDVTWPLGGG